MVSEIPDSASAAVNPLTETERKIALLWKEILELTHVPDRNDNFFALGGDSVAMVAVELRINEEFTVELPAGSLLTSPSLFDLAIEVDKYSDRAGSDMKV